MSKPMLLSLLAFLVVASPNSQAADAPAKNEVFFEEPISSTYMEDPVPVPESVEEEAADPVAQAITACMDRDDAAVTAARLDCYELGIRKYQAAIGELNRQLRAQSTAAEQAAVTAAQRSWEQFLKNQIKVMTTIRAKLQGTMFTEAAADFELGLYAGRYADLKRLAELKDATCSPDC